MPIYTYRCRACGAVEEHIQKVNDRPKQRCAACSGRLDKQISVAAFHLKGGGWYADGYGSKKQSEGGGEGGGEGGEVGKSKAGEAAAPASEGGSDAGKGKGKGKGKGSGAAKEEPRRGASPGASGRKADRPREK
jgi:putative FmdB family regulatory protein